MSLLTLIAVPFIAAVLLMAARQATRRVHVLIAAAGSAIGLAVLLAEAEAVLAGETPMLRIAWLPALGVDFSLWLDPLALLFAGLLLGIGCSSSSMRRVISPRGSRPPASSPY